MAKHVVAKIYRSWGRGRFARRSACCHGLVARACRTEKLVGPFARWMHRTRCSSPRALYTSPEVAGHVCATSEHILAKPARTYNIQIASTRCRSDTHRNAIHFSGVRGRYARRSPDHCAVTDRWIVPINKREGNLPGILLDILECPRFLTCPRTWHLSTYLSTYTFIARWWRWSFLFINASSPTSFLRRIIPDRCGEIWEPRMDEETKQQSEIYRRIFIISLIY